MSKAHYEIAIHNLNLIYNSEKESLHKNDFKDEIGRPLKDSTEVISLLLKHDIIENEDEPDLYFLAPETYELIENDQIEIHLWHLMDLGDFEDRFDDDKTSRELRYQLIEPEEEKKKPPYFIYASKYVIGIIFVIILSLIYYISPFSPPEKKLPPQNALSGLSELLQNNVDLRFNFAAARAKAVELYVSNLYDGDKVGQHPLITSKADQIEILNLPELESLSSYTLYAVNISNGSHFEYNQGLIPTVLAYDYKEPDSSKLFVPTNYCCNEANEEFLGKLQSIVFEKKERAAKEIVKVFLSIQKRNRTNCKKEIYDLTFSSQWTNEKLTVKTNYTANCAGWNSAKNPSAEFEPTLFSNSTDFFWLENKIDSISIREWK